MPYNPRIFFLPPQKNKYLEASVLHTTFPIPSFSFHISLSSIIHFLASFLGLRICFFKLGFFSLFFRDYFVVFGMENEQMELPPGFRFHPTDEELITHYLSKKVYNSCFCAIAIGEVDLNKCEPWDLPCKFPFSLFSSVSNRVFKFRIYSNFMLLFSSSFLLI